MGGSGGILINFLWKQEWLMAVAMFPIMIITVAWATFTESFLTKIQDYAKDFGEHGANVFVKWLKVIASGIKWQLAGVEDKYLQCLKLTDDSLFYLTEGLKQKESKLLLADVFIPLKITGEFMRIPPGFDYDSNTLEEIEAKTNVEIWTLLKKAQQNPAYYSLIITATGGLGKTTLLKHLTYIYAQKKYRSYQAPELIPVLLYLRRWQKEIVSENPPDLPTLIKDYYIPNLPGGKDLQFSDNWATNHLRNGKMLIMFDGFDIV